MVKALEASESNCSIISALTVALSRSAHVCEVPAVPGADSLRFRTPVHCESGGLSHTNQEVPDILSVLQFSSVCCCLPGDTVRSLS